MAASKLILTDQEKANIVKYTEILGMEREVMVGRLLLHVKELADQPVAIMRTVKEFISKLGREAALHELSLDLEKEAAPERLPQLKEMEVEVNKVLRALEEGNMAGITHGHRVLKDQLEKYHGGLDAVKDGEKVSLDPTGVWQQKAAELTKEVMEKSGRYMERGTDEDDGPLLPLRRAMGGLADLTQGITELEAEPNEANLRLLGRDLNEAKVS